MVLMEDREECGSAEIFEAVREHTRAEYWKRRQLISGVVSLEIYEDRKQLGIFLWTAELAPAAARPADRSVNLVDTDGQIALVIKCEMDSQRKVKLLFPRLNSDGECRVFVDDEEHTFQEIAMMALDSVLP